MAPKRAVKKPLLQKTSVFRKHQERDGNEGGRDVRGVQAPRSGLSRRVRGKGRRSGEKDDELSDLGKKRAPSSPERTTSDLVAEEAGGRRRRSGTGTVVPPTITDNGEGCEISTPQRETQDTPEGMRVVRRREDPLEGPRAASAKSRGLEQGISEKEREGRVVQNVGTVFEGHAEEENCSVLPRMELLQKFNSVKGELKKMKEDYYSLMQSLKLSQKEVERLVGKLKEQDILIDSLREAGKATKCRGRERDEEKGGVRKRRKYDIEVQERFYGFARFVYDRILDYAKLEASELCFDWESVARSWKNRSEEVGEVREGSAFVVGDKEMVPRSPVEVASELSLYTPSTKGGCEELLRYVAEKEIMGERWDSIRRGGKMEECVEEVTRDRCLRQRVKQSLSDVVGVRKRASREKLFSLLGYDLIATRARAEEGTELGAELRKQMEEAREKLGGDSEKESDVLCRWRTKPIEDLLYSGSAFSSRICEFKEPDLYFKNAVAIQVLEHFIGYRVECERNGRKTYVDGTVMHLARLDAWVACVVKSMNADAGRGGQRQMVFSTLYAEYLPRAVDCILKTAWETVKAEHGGEFENNGVRGEEEREVTGNSERRATIAMWVPSTQKLHLAVKETYFMRNMTRHLGAVLDCYIASCRPEDSMFERATEVNEAEGETENAVGEVGVVGEEENVYED